MGHIRCWGLNCAQILFLPRVLGLSSSILTEGPAHGRGAPHVAAVRKSCRDTWMASSRVGGGCHLGTGRS